MNYWNNNHATFKNTNTKTKKKETKKMIKYKNKSQLMYRSLSRLPKHLKYSSNHPKVSKFHPPSEQKKISYVPLD